jgi:crotonyl-CoA reductase
MSKAYDLTDVGTAANEVHHNRHEGKLAVRCLAPEPGLGIEDPEKRERIGEHNITRFERHAASIEN